jgi:ABC-2 type transport system permease protein
MDVWLALFFVFSGYTVPLELFPPFLREAIAWMPFRYQIGLPVELMIGAHGRYEALGLLARQWLVVAAMFVALNLVWRRGVRRFAAYGG